MIPKVNVITSSGAQLKKEKEKSISSKDRRKIGCPGLTERWCVSFQLGIFLRDFQGLVC